MKFLKKIIFSAALVILFSNFPINVKAQSDYTFSRPEFNKFLSHNSVQCIHQDAYGFIWFGTEAGLDKFDGYNVTEYLYNPKDSNSISNNNILSIYEDPQDSGTVLWIGTNDGLIRFDRLTEKFRTYKVKLDENSSLQLNLIKTICSDKKGNFWFGGNGLKKFNKQTGIIAHYLTSLSSIFIYSIWIDQNETLWLGTNEGLVKFNLNTEEYKTYKLHEDNPNNVNRNSISAVQLDGKILWVGTYEGLYTFEIQKERFSRPTFSFGDPNFSLVREIKLDKNDNIWVVDGELYKINKNRDSLVEYPQRIIEDRFAAARLSSLLIDNSGNLWIGLLKNGIIKGNPVRKKFSHFKYDPNNSLSLNFNDVTSFMEDKSGYMWIGASLGGLNKFNKRTKEFYVVSGSPVAYNITKDLNGILWCSCIGAIQSYDPVTNYTCAYFGNGSSSELVEFKISEDQRMNIARREILFNAAVKRKQVEMRDAGNGIFYCYAENDGTMWALIGPGRMINKFIPDKSLFIPYTLRAEEDLSNSILFLFEDSNNVLWFGTDGKGLVKRVKIDDGNVKFLQYKNIIGNYNSISSNIVNTICEDDSGYFWVGTDIGLNKFNPITETFTRYSVNDGLPSDLIAGIVIDDFGKIWISTNKGISSFDPHSKKFRNFDESYGLQSNTFNIRSCYKDSEGYIYFGGSNGFNMFKPQEIIENPNLPKLCITKIQINNSPVHIGPNSPLKKPIEFSDEIILAHDQNVLTFEFSALEYTNPNNNSYAYMLEGADHNWVFANADRRFASYTQLSPGDYVFRVRGTNNDGIWSTNEAVLSITILPPWWRTIWAYLFYILLLVVVTYSIWRVRINRLKLQHQAEIEHLQAEKLQEMDRMKSRFFANISHEFRTPLTLILGIVNKISSQIKESKNKGELKTVHRYALKLNNLVDQLLDLSKLEAGKMKLDLIEVNIIPMLRGMVNAFASLAETKNISLSFSSSVERVILKIDQHQFEKIINNLLINAFKFTPNGGKINVILKQIASDIELQISDSGIGIPEERLDKIFDRFYQADDTHTREFEGTGIGLSLTKELVELHKGKISVRSKEGKGTTFIIHFPIDEEIQTRLETEEFQFTFKNFEPVTDQFIVSDEINGVSIYADSEKPMLLIVEDNIDVRKYVKSYFDAEYNVIEACDGIQGKEKSLEFIPDVIISDIMMPNMDGFQLLEKLKTDDRTNHIPVILLTAKASDEDKIDGLEIGADDYMMKPFDAEELQVRVKNLILQRQRIRDHFKKEGVLNITDEKIESVDKLFLQKAVKIIDEHLSDSKFGVEQFSSEMTMSRQQLRRKFISIIGESPSDFVRRIRLTKAAKLIKQNAGNISEIAYQVGFENPAYFAQSFKKFFGISPSEYESKNKRF